MAEITNFHGGETSRAETDERLGRPHGDVVHDPDVGRAHRRSLNVLILRYMSTRPIAAIIVGAMAFVLACGGSVEDTNRAVVINFVDEFKNRANHNIVDELLTTDFVHHFKDPRLPPGRDAMKFLGQSVVGGFPDVQVTVDDLFADGDFVIERTTARATHTGEFFGVPATGAPVVWTEIHIYRLRDGKVAELWSEVDFISLMTQIGAMPGP